MTRFFVKKKDVVHEKKNPTRSIFSGHEMFSVANIMAGRLSGLKTFISGVFCTLEVIFGYPSLGVCWGSGSKKYILCKRLYRNPM